MDKLKFNFAMVASENQKSNEIVITSIETSENKTYIMPEEVKKMQFHVILASTPAYNKIKNSLQKRHQRRSVWIPLSKELKEIYLDEGVNVIYGDYYLEEMVAETQINVTEASSSMQIPTMNDSLKPLEAMLKKFMDEKDSVNLTKISSKFLIEKFSNKNTNAKQWITDFENECLRYEVNTDKKIIEIFKLFLEKSCLDWYSSMLMKFTITSEWKIWKENFIMTYSSKGWTPSRYAITFKYKSGLLVDYAVKKERLLLEMRNTIDTGTLIDLIAVGLPNSISDRIDRESLENTQDLYHELGKLEHLAERKIMSESNNNYYKSSKPNKTFPVKVPCKICEKNNNVKRYHPESLCWFKKENLENKNDKIRYVNNSELENELLREDPKN